MSILVSPLPILGLLSLSLAVLVIQCWSKTQRLPPGPKSLGQAIAKVGPKAPQWVVLDSLKDDYGKY